MKCIFCKSSKYIECINLGFVKCQWNYKGSLNNTKSSGISGDGLTIDDKLYVLNEMNMLNLLEVMNIKVKEVKIKYDLNAINYNSKYIQKEIIEDDVLDTEEFSMSSHRQKQGNFSKIKENTIINDEFETNKNENENIICENNKDDNLGIKLDSCQNKACFNFGDNSYCSIY
jgi:hypothetical protein